ncbi:hypothetical protein JMN32_19615 [Fulvivirga sp. 29W222]|uniref:Uncharacterized protein n=1 Tax=Fulvivirga marina TaxID=2494733 RepID=A0A937G108_9BACT|nr:hypothetical protein [Fulvivirga marina]MBL6448528.1 hypothetical protein [Fulvivirga marina]
MKLKLRRLSDGVSRFFRKNLRPTQTVSSEDSSDTIEYTVKCRLRKDITMSSATIKEIILQNPWSTLSPPAITFHTDEQGKSSVTITFKVLSPEKGKLVENELRSALTDREQEESND